MTVLEVKDRLKDLVVDTKWDEGYISAIVDNKIINEEQFEELLDWIHEEL